MPPELQPLIYAIVANILVIATGMGVQRARKRNLALTREEAAAAQTGLITEQFKKYEKRASDLEQLLQQKDGLHSSEMAQLNEKIILAEHEISKLKSTKERDDLTINNLNAQLQDVPELRKQVSSLTAKVDAITKSNQELSEELAKERELRKDSERQYSVLKASYDEIKTANQDMRNVVEVMQIFAQQQRQQSTEAPAPEPQPGGGEAKESVE